MEVFATTTSLTRNSLTNTRSTNDARLLGQDGVKLEDLTWSIPTREAFQALIKRPQLQRALSAR